MKSRLRSDPSAIGSTNVDRRKFLAGLTASAALPALMLPSAARSMPTNPDVVIVGAGAAGIAAAHLLAQRGISFVVVEAKDWIGGRAFTETASFGVPFDHGASWIYQADHNPLTPMAHRAGFGLIPHDDAKERLFVGSTPASYYENAAYQETWYEVETTLRAIAHSGQDVAAASRLPANLPWSDVVKTWLGPIDMGMEIESFSAADWWSLDMATPSLLVCEGVGSVVSSIGKDIPVQTSTPVTTIKWGGAEGVTVETPAGTIQAKAVIVTVSTGVLAAESIQFDPPLPTETVRAIDNLPMGLLAKVGLQFDGSTNFGMRANEWLSYTCDCSQLSYFLSWPCDTNMMVGFVGGKFAWDLTKAGEKAAVDFALGELRRIFGPEVDRSFVAGRFTGWGTDANVRGAYAVAKPGGHKAREQLARSHGDRLFFAGEALAGGMATTVGGAFVNGRQVADIVAREIA
jgi:monoamine oxidase